MQILQTLLMLKMSVSENRFKLSVERWEALGQQYSAFSISCKPYFPIPPLLSVYLANPLEKKKKGLCDFVFRFWNRLCWNTFTL